jgi:hypothetical protein
MLVRRPVPPVPVIAVSLANPRENPQLTAPASSPEAVQARRQNVGMASALAGEVYQNLGPRALDYRTAIGSSASPAVDHGPVTEAGRRNIQIVRTALTYHNYFSSHICAYTKPAARLLGLRPPRRSHMHIFGALRFSRCVIW